MNTCLKCDLVTELKCCPCCGDNLSPQSGASREETLRSSDWVGEWEAELLRTKPLHRDAYAGGNQIEAEYWRGYRDCLRAMIEKERSHSATVEVSHRREEASDV